jgi:hypothetical protein
MSRLFFTERGRVLLHANEEIGRWRWARKLLRVSKPVEQAELWLFVRPFPGSNAPLQIIVNRKTIASVRPQRNETAWQWRRVKLPARILRAGENEIIVRCDSPAMNAWMLGIEAGHANPASFLSVDRGESWSNRNMGAAVVLRGEYLIRLRAGGEQLRDLRPPSIVYENRVHPRVRELASLIPASIRNMRGPWRQVLALRTWVTRAWKYEAYGRCYAPWDPWTVLAWKRANWGHGYENPIAMCVHYGMVFTSLASALGHVARGITITQDVNSPHGHFMTEIWSDQLAKWIAHDASYDLHYELEQPLSIVELAHEARSNCFQPEMRRGSGFTSKDPRLLQILREQLKTGRSFANVGVWRLNDVISQPSGAAPSHGSVNYCETDFVWYAGANDRATAMFPYRTSDRSYFARAPKRA